jgi:enoyl-CoA hydratase/methylglutaconyl-CoA hydratase
MNGGAPGNNGPTIGEVWGRGDGLGEDGGVTELVHLGAAAGVATITLDSPHNRNALSQQLTGELLAQLETAGADDMVRAIVIRSAGDVFCSGADLSEATTVGMGVGAQRMVDVQRAIVANPKPVVARVAGPVRAGGIGIVAAADISIAGHSSTFALTEVRLGLAAATISLTVIPRLTDRAASLTFLTGDGFDGVEAAQLGLVTRSVPDYELDVALDAVLASLLKGVPQGLRETKKLLNRKLLADIDARGTELAELSAGLFGSDAAREAMLAFLNRKRP